jgi:hypothetical protein
MARLKRNSRGSRAAAHLQSVAQPIVVAVRIAGVVFFRGLIGIDRPVPVRIGERAEVDDGSALFRRQSGESAAAQASDGFGTGRRSRDSWTPPD